MAPSPLWPGAAVITSNSLCLSVSCFADRPARPTIVARFAGLGTEVRFRFPGPITRQNEVEP